MSADRKIRVLVVEDSNVARELLVHILESDPALRVIGTAGNGEEALAILADAQPDVITMDIHMPKMDGFEATRRIMETRPVPIVIVTASYSRQDVELSFRAMEAGAVAILEKPRAAAGAAASESVRKLLQTVNAMSEVRVIRRWRRHPEKVPAFVELKDAPSQLSRIPRIKVIAIGASTGGPPVLRTILAGLPVMMPCPILIVQHISAGFVQGLVDWLGSGMSFPVKLGVDGEQALAGRVYVAPDGVQMGVDETMRISLKGGEPEGGLRPAVSYLFRSVLRAAGDGALGILLTGMGKDGAAELQAMRARGALTIAQDMESSIVHGMPGEAIRLGAATHVFPPEKIAAMLTAIMQEQTAR